MTPRLDKALISLKELEIREIKLNAEERLQRLEAFERFIRDGGYAFIKTKKKKKCQQQT